MQGQPPATGRARAGKGEIPMLDGVKDLATCGDQAEGQAL